MSRRVVTAREQVEMLSPWREAMADTAPWHPLIDRTNGFTEGMGRHRFRPMTYDVRLPDSHPQAGTLVGRLEATKSPHEREVYVDSISAHPKYQGQGIAQALIERLIADHPDHHINPGVTTDQGAGFTQRLMDSVPDAKSKVAPGWKLSPISPEGNEDYKQEIDDLWSKHGGRDSDIQEYRTERHRQRMELEEQTGNYAADVKDHFDRGGKPLITYKDWLKARGGERDKAGPVTREVYTPDPAQWADDNDLPAWVTAHLAAIPDNDPLWALLGSPPGGTPAFTPPPQRPPPDPDRYYKHLIEQPDRTHTAHAWLPTDVVDHYREYDRDTRNPDYQAVKRAVGEQGVKLPLWISANDTHGLLVEGNNRLQAAKELGIPHLPVRFTHNDPPMSNEGNAPVAHHPAVRDWLAQNRHKLANRYRTSMEDNVVTLYSKPACPQCNATKKALDKHGIPHQVIDLTTDPDAYHHVTQNLGYSAAPVVVAGDDHWTGFRPDRIEALRG